MELSNTLIKQFSKAITPTSTKISEATVYGKMATSSTVQFDGSTMATPVETTVAAAVGDRVTVLVKNHTATVTGNLTSPAAKDSDVQSNTEEIASVKKTVDENGNSIAATNNNITAINNDITAINNDITAIGNDIEAQYNEIELIGNTVTADHSEIENLWSTVNTYGSTITSDHAEIESLWSTVNTYGSTVTSDHAEIETLWSTVNTYGSEITSNQTQINNQWSTIENLGTSISTLNSSIEVYNSSFKVEDGVVTGIKGVDTEWITTESLEATQATIESLSTTYANIDFANIGTAAIENFIATSGLIQDAVVGNQTVTGELVGVTISGDLIKANTIAADKLIVKGSDGLYYALNVDSLGETTASADEKYQSGLDGSVIIAQSITADKISVTDLTAFGATIAQFNIADDSIYSGAKTTVDNTTRGIYMDTDGQFAFGDANNYIKFYKTDDGSYELDIASSGLSEEIDAVNTTANTALSTANTASTNASSALTTANTANTNASSALTTANTANTNATNAAKTATNFLSYSSSSGLQIGNKTSGSWSGSRAQITSSAFNILNSSGVELASFGTTSRIGKSTAQNVYVDSDSVDIMYNGSVCASFSTDEILLGQYSASSSIGFCQSKGYIEYSSSSSTFTLGTSSILRLKSSSAYISLAYDDVEIYAADSTGTVILDGAGISANAKLYATAGLVASSISADGSNFFSPCISKGDSFSAVRWTGAGYVTSTKTQVHFTIPVSRPIIGSPTVTVTTYSGLIIRQEGNYTHGSTYNTYAKPSSYSAVLVSNLFIRVVATFSTVTNAVNNAACGIEAYINIKFS